MQVWFVSTQHAWGGGEVYLEQLAYGLRQLVKHVDVRFAAPSRSPLAERMRAAGFPLFAFEGKGRNPRTVWQLRQQLRLDTQLPSQFDSQVIVHCNDSHALTLGGLASLGVATAKTIGMRHTMFPIRSTGKYHRLAQRVICVSQAVAESCIDDGLQPDRLSVVHVGIPQPEVSAAHAEAVRRDLCRPDERLIVAVGNLLECKGHAALIDAVDALQSDQRPLVLAIAGEGKQREKLEEQIARLRHPAKIRLLGFQDNPNDWLAAADVVVHPSYQEGLCLTVVAAMMLARPVVATAVGGLREVIAAQETDAGVESKLATICEPGKAQSIADGIEAALIEGAERSRLMAAQAFAIEHFSVTKMVEQTVAVYEDVWRARRATA